MNPTIKWFDLSEYGLLVHKLAVGDKATGQKFAIVVSGAVNDHEDSLVHLGLNRTTTGVYATQPMPSEQLRAAPVMSAKAITAVFPKLRLADANPALVQKNVREAPIFVAVEAKPPVEELVMASVYLSLSDGTVEFVGRVNEVQSDGYLVVVLAGKEKIALRRDDFATAFSNQFSGPDAEELPERFLRSVRTVPAPSALDSRSILLSSITSAMPPEMVRFAKRSTIEQFELEFAKAPEYRRFLGRLQNANDVAKIVSDERRGLYLIARSQDGADLADHVVLQGVLETALSNPMLDRQDRAWIDGMLSSHVKMSAINNDLEDRVLGEKRLALLAKTAAFMGVSEYGIEPEADLDIALAEDIAESIPVASAQSSKQTIDAQWAELQLGEVATLAAALPKVAEAQAETLAKAAEDISEPLFPGGFEFDFGGTLRDQAFGIIKLGQEGPLIDLLTLIDANTTPDTAAVNSATLNDYGRLNKVTATIDRDKAKAYFESLAGEPIKPGLAVVKSSILMQKFILAAQEEATKRKIAEAAVEKRADVWAERIARMTLVAEARDLYDACERRRPESGGYDMPEKASIEEIKGELLDEHPDALDAAEADVIKRFYDHLKRYARTPVEFVNSRAQLARLAKEDRLANLFTSLAAAMDARDIVSLTSLIGFLDPGPIQSIEARIAFFAGTGFQLPKDAKGTADTLRYWLKLASAAQQLEVEAKPEVAVAAEAPATAEASGILSAETQLRADAWNARIAQMGMAEAKDFYDACGRRRLVPGGVFERLRSSSTIDEVRAALEQEHPDDLDAAENILVERFQKTLEVGGSSLVNNRASVARLNNKAALATLLTSLARAMDARDIAKLIAILGETTNVSARSAFSDGARLELSDDTNETAETLRYWVRLATKADVAGAAHITKNISFSVQSLDKKITVRVVDSATGRGHDVEVIAGKSVEVVESALMFEPALKKALLLMPSMSGSGSVVLGGGIASRGGIASKSHIALIEAIWPEDAKNLRPETEAISAEIPESKADAEMLPAAELPAPTTEAGEAKLHRYALVNRPFGTFSAPPGLLSVEPRPAPEAPHYGMARHGVLVYGRQLTDSETSNLELSPMVTGKDLEPYALQVIKGMGRYVDRYLAEPEADYLEAVEFRLRDVTNLGFRPSLDIKELGQYVRVLAPLNKDPAIEYFKPVAPKLVPAHVQLLRTIYESEVSQIGNVHLQGIVIRDLKYGAEPIIFDSLLKGFGVDSFNEMTPGLQKTARILNKAIIELDVAVLKDVLWSANKTSRRAFQLVFGNIFELPRSDKNTNKLLTSLVSILKGDLAPEHTELLLTSLTPIGERRLAEIQAEMPASPAIATTDESLVEDKPVALAEKFKSLVMLAANSIEKLRKGDVYRVLDNCPINDLNEFGKYLGDARPDLATEIAESLVEIWGELGAVTDTITADLPANDYLRSVIDKEAYEAIINYGGNEGYALALQALSDEKLPGSPLKLYSKAFDSLVSDRVQIVREQLIDAGWEAGKKSFRNDGALILVTPAVVAVNVVGVKYSVLVERNTLEIVDLIDREPVAFARFMIDRIDLERNSNEAKIDREIRLSEAKYQEDQDELQRSEKAARREARSGSSGSTSTVAGEHSAANEGEQPESDLGGAVRAGSNRDYPVAPRTRQLSSLRNFQMSTRFLRALVDFQGSNISESIRTRNMTALRVLEQLEVEERLDAPTVDEKDALALYGGWGAAADKLASIDVPEKIALIQSTGSAFYTPPNGSDALWAAAMKAGFTGGTVLEAGAGVGSTIARMPEALRATTRVIAVEREPHAARILKVLNPDADVLSCDFKVAPIAPESVDLVIGNFPFGTEAMRDGRYPNAGLHDYFLMHSMSKLKPGGVMVVLTSTYTLDSISSSVRQYVQSNQNADLLTAVRLPNGLFVGTDVAVDCLVLRKRLPNERALDSTWVQSKRATEDGKEFSYNAAAAWKNDNFDTIKVWSGGPNFVVGRERFGHRLRSAAGNWLSVTDQLTRRVPENVLDTSATAFVEAVVETPKFEHPSGYVWIDGATVMHHNGNTIEVMRGNPKQVRLWADYVPLRDAARAVLAAQLDVSDETLAAAQSQLGMVYDKFKASYGPVNLHRSVLDKEPYSALVFSLEQYDAKAKTATKTPFFNQRTLSIRSNSIPTTPTDAVFASFDLLGRIDEAQIESWLSRPFAEIAFEAQDVIIRSPETNTYELLDNYLSGDLHEKLETAQAALELDPGYQRNISVLTAELGQMIQRTDISVMPGVTWIPIEDYQEWANQLYSFYGASSAPKIERSMATGRWIVKSPRSDYSSLNVEGFTLTNMVERALNQQSVKIMHKPGTTNEKTGKPLEGLDFETTVLVNEKLRAVERHFKTWVWSDDARANRLEREYNLRFNTYRRGKFDAARAGVTIPGFSIACGKTLRPTQLSAVMRGMLCQGMLLGHEVGVGKTLTMAALTQKWRSVGMVNRSLMAVKKNTLWSIAREITTAFPAATVLVAEAKDMTKAGRLEFLRKVQTTNPSVVLMTHGGFRKIRLPLEAEIAGISATMLRFERAQSALIDSGSRTAEVKTLGRKISDLSRRMERLFESRDKTTDDLTLAQLGIGALLYDESQALKNLQVITAEPMLGIPTTSSMRAEDALMKVDWLREQGCKIVFATGTPISNSLVECYNLQRFLAPAQLRNAGVEEFDAWKAQFATGRSQIEADPGASGYRLVTRLAEMKNVPELISMMSVWADVVTADQAGIVRPAMSQVTIDVEPTVLQQRFRDVLAAETQFLRAEPSAAIDSGINILSILGNARCATLDLATKYPSLPEGAGGRKIGVLARQVAEIYAQSNDRTQAVFLDIGTPKKKNSGKFDAYAALKKQLIERGVKADEICFIHDCPNDQAKAAMFEALNKGEKRIIVGSTEKMGEGSNFQQRLIATHHVNATYNPAGLTQRNGRMLRFGNTNPHVQSLYYVTRNLLEDWNWSLVRTKQGFIDQIMQKLANRTDVALSRIIEEDTAVNVAAIEAAASGNPLIKKMFDLESKIKFADALLVAREGEGIALKNRIEMEESNKRSLTPMIAKLKSVADALAESIDNFSITIDDVAYTKASEAGTALYKKIAGVSERSAYSSRYTEFVVAKVCGHDLLISNSNLSAFNKPDAFGETISLHFRNAESFNNAVLQNVADRAEKPWIITQRIKALVEHISTGLKRWERERDDREKKLTSLREAASVKIDNSEHERMVAELSALRVEVQANNKGFSMSLFQAQKALLQELDKYGVLGSDVDDDLDEDPMLGSYDDDDGDVESEVEKQDKADTDADVDAEFSNLPSAIAYTQKFMGKNQRMVLKECLKGEEKEYFEKFYIELAGKIRDMPKTYEQNEVDDPIAHLHYFQGGSDWFVFEKDIEGGVDQVFGYACLNGDTQNAELGYFSISEIVSYNVELDFNFTPIPLSQCKARIGTTVEDFRKIDDSIDKALENELAVKPQHAFTVKQPVTEKQQNYFDEHISQYLTAKAKNPATILLYRMGDYYSLFYDDARRGAEVLDLSLNKMTRSDGTYVPMASIPHFALDSTLTHFSETGEPVAVCEADRKVKLFNADGSIADEVVQRIQQRIQPSEDVIERVQPRRFGS